MIVLLAATLAQAPANVMPVTSRAGMLQDCASTSGADDRFLFAVFWQQGAGGKRVYDALIVPQGALKGRLGRTEFQAVDFATAPLPPKDGKPAETFLFIKSLDSPGSKPAQFTLSGATTDGTLREMNFELHIGSDLVKGACRKSRPTATDSDELK